MKRDFLVWGLRFFVSDVISRALLSHFGPTSSGPGSKPQDGSILLKLF